MYQTEVDDEVAGYSDKLSGHCGRLPQRRASRGDERPGDGRQVEARPVAFRLFGRINPETRVIEAAGFKTRMPGDDGVRERHLLDDRGAHFRRGAGAHH